jgi:hypothetical protein
VLKRLIVHEKHRGTNPKRRRFLPKRQAHQSHLQKVRCGFTSPLYYALLYLSGDENYHRCPPELSEPVAEIIEQIKGMAVDYA